MTISTVPPVETIAPGLVTKVRDGDLAGTQRGLIAAGIAALLASGWFASGEAMVQQAYFSYLVAYMFALSLVLGALFFVMLHHLTRAGWSVVVRRVAENVMAVMPWMAVLFIPIVVGSEELYHWLHPAEGDGVLAGKAAYLNAPFFYIRAAIYFAIWIALAFWFRRTSLKQDQTGDPQLTLKMSRVAAPGMLLFSFTITFAAFDWIMSLDPHWYSTIFGVCYFAGSFMAILAYLTLLCLWLNRRGYLKDSVTVEHYHDLGKLMFAFMIFWTYVNFSQYFLIWYANLPEETAWFLHRLHGGWELVGIILILGHFAVPFVFLLSRHVKRNLTTLAIGAGFMLVMHWVDMQYLIMPNMVTDAEAAQGSWFSNLSWLDATTMLGILLLITGFAIAGIRRAPVLPERDPRLLESLGFENH